MLKNFFKGKNVFITGVAGSIGNNLLRKIIKLKPKNIFGLDNNETALFDVEMELGRYFTVVLGDIRDSERLDDLFKNIDIIFHCAALKHVPICEIYPFESIQTNIIGTQNIINAAKKNNVKYVVSASSDKAVNPTNVMGTSKLMAEQLIKAANLENNKSKTIFTCVRFGNVMNSRGSVLPLFKKQISNELPITITDKKMTRFIMTIDKAVELLIEALKHAKGGDIFITKMYAINIIDLAELLIKRSKKKINIKVVGTRPGEKMFEELMNEEEVRRSLEIDKYYVISPAQTNLYKKNFRKYNTIKSLSINNPYNSKFVKKLTKKDLEEFLSKNNLL